MPFDRKEYMKQYRLKNKEAIKENKKQYREKNKESIKEYNKNYYKGYKFTKSYYISHWKSIGVVDDYEFVYDRWSNINNCEKCNVELIGSNKCLDHCHETGKFRKILCIGCNVHNIEDNSYKNKKNIYFLKNRNKYRFIKTIKGVKYLKDFNTLDEAIIYKQKIIDTYIKNLSTD